MNDIINGDTRDEAIEVQILSMLNPSSSPVPAVGGHFMINLTSYAFSPEISAVFISNLHFEKLKYQPGVVARRVHCTCTPS